MSQLKTRPRRTVDDYLKLPEGTRAELIEGEILMTPSPKLSHQVVSRNLFVHLDSFVRTRGLGEALYAPMDVHLPSGDIVQPDVLFVATANAGIMQDWIRGAPDLLVEILSPEGVERDRMVKRDLYARNGVKEYWLVDPEARSVEVLGLNASGRYEPSGYFEERDTVVSPLLAGLSLPVAKLFQ
ncbi:MAG: Uma2 family endonuclease [Candidatus Coatesbacteria bacterium]